MHQSHTTVNSAGLTTLIPMQVSSQHTVHYTTEPRHVYSSQMKMEPKQLTQTVQVTFGFTSYYVS